MNAELFSLIMAGIIAFVCTFCIVPLCIRLAYSINFVDVPDGKHKQHVRITPYLGGVAVYLGFFIAFVLTSPGHVSYLFFGGITLLLMIGLFDDFKPITPRQKFIGQCMATLCFLQAGFYLKEQFFYSFLNIFISAFWIVSLINAFNLIDIMDGLATVTALGAATTFLGLALYCKLYTVGTLLMAFIGSLFAFLWYNRPTARIYLGDAGSLWIGGFLASIPFFFSWGSYTWYGCLTPIIPLAIPFLELITLIVVRTYKKIPFYHGSRDHFALYMLDNGWSKYGILAYIIGTSFFLAVGSVLLFTGITPPFFVLGMGGVFVVAWYGVLVVKMPLKPLKTAKCNTKV